MSVTETKNEIKEMKSELTRAEACTVNVLFTIPRETVKKRIDALFGQIQKSATLPGFRQGKVPPDLVRKNFADIARNDFLQKIIPEAVDKVCREHNLFIVGETEIDALDFDFDKDLTFKATFEVKPEVHLKEYKNIKVKKEKVEITEDSVQKVLENLRERAAQLVVAEHDALIEGDYAVVDYELFHDGKSVADGKSQNQVLIVEKDKLLPGLAEKLVGMKKNDEKEVALKMPEDFAKKELAGKEVTFKVLVKEIKEKKLPELNDDFVKELGEKITLAELRERIKKNVQDEEESRVRKQMEEQIIDHLVKEHEIPLPKILVERQVEYLIERAKQMVVQQGKTPEGLGLTDEIITAKVKPDAERHVKTYLLLEAIAKQENLNVTEEEINKEIQKVVEQTKQAEEVVRGYFAKNISKITSHMEEDKVFSFLLANAKIQEIAQKKKSTSEGSESETPKS